MTVHSHAQYSLPLRPVILGWHPMKQTHLDCNATLPLNPLSALGILGGVGSPVTKRRLVLCPLRREGSRVINYV